MEAATVFGHVSATVKDLVFEGTCWILTDRQVAYRRTRKDPFLPVSSFLSLGR